jgi:phosphoribosylformylglycinamidine cyclo-ligase
MADSLTYADAGVDIDRANALVRTIRNIARKTNQPGVLGDIGGFGGLFALDLADCQRPVLVSSTDGVGTKLKLAFMMNRHDSIGIDLVAMCVNDVLVQGARPLFFLDYFSTGRLEPQVATDVITGIADGCRQAKCALIGGETAEMPDMYPAGEYDLAGFCVGLVDHSKIIDGSRIRKGDQLLGIAASGLHSNGFSLVRKICFDVLDLKFDSYVPELSRSIGEELLTPTCIYASTVETLLKEFQVHALAHVTGGGLAENLDRVVPAAFGLELRRDSWEVPPVFSFLQRAGNVSDAEMQRTFNNGIGLVAIMPEKQVEDASRRLNAMGQKAFLIGEIRALRPGGERIKWN